MIGNGEEIPLGCNQTPNMHSLSCETEHSKVVRWGGMDDSRPDSVSRWWATEPTINTPQVRMVLQIIHRKN